MSYFYVARFILRNRKRNGYAARLSLWQTLRLIWWHWEGIWKGL